MYIMMLVIECFSDSVIGFGLWSVIIYMAIQKETVAAGGG